MFAISMFNPRGDWVMALALAPPGYVGTSPLQIVQARVALRRDFLDFLLAFFFVFAFVPTMLEIAASIFLIALVSAADALAKVPFLFAAIVISV